MWIDQEGLSSQFLESEQYSYFGSESIISTAISSIDHGNQQAEIDLASETVEIIKQIIELQSNLTDQTIKIGLLSPDQSSFQMRANEYKKSKSHIIILYSLTLYKIQTFLKSVNKPSFTQSMNQKKQLLKKDFHIYLTSYHQMLYKLRRNDEKKYRIRKVKIMPQNKDHKEPFISPINPIKLPKKQSQIYEIFAPHLRKRFGKLTKSIYINQI